MGKTVKGKGKAKAKAAKAKAKIARKCKVAAIVSALVIAAILTGCTTADSAQPAKSQTQENRFDGCTFVMAAKATISNGVIVADGGAAPALEMFTQTQSLESTGSTDTFGQANTQTPTTDIKPDVNVNYAQGGGISNRGTGGSAGTGGAAGIIGKLAETLSADGLSSLKSALANKTDGTVTLEKKDGTTTTATCKDGSCTLEDGTVVTAADCDACSACSAK